MRQSPLLEEISLLRFDVIRHGSLDVLTTMPALHTLRIKEYSSHACDFLDHLLLPSLRTLDLLQDIGLKSFREDLSSIFPVLRELCARSQCNLTHLGWIKRFRNLCYPIAVSDETCLELLAFLQIRSLQDLSSLSLGEGITNLVFRRLTWDPNTEINDQLLPNLTTLNVSSSYTSDGVLSSMITSRWNRSRLKEAHRPATLVHVRLRQVELAVRRSHRDKAAYVELPLTSNDYHRLVMSDLVEQGLDIEFE
ncbi:hypothetical protein C0995_010330 [Termitomyces sp. Mi166|nr:hypothetical protein C0995_010330 [Termitomyces sp. Mi166\